MIIKEALDRIIEIGIEAVKRDYKPNTDKFNGSIAGFEACRNKNPQELLQLLNNAKKESNKAFIRSSTNDEGYWFIRCFEAEVEWVCNVMSAILQNNNLPIIITPTCRGVMMAATIIGIKD